MRTLTAPLPQGESSYSTAEIPRERIAMAENSQGSIQVDVEVDKEEGASGIWKLFGEYPPETLISKNAIAGLMDKHPASIDRAVSRGELPPPIKMAGEARWTIESINKHIKKRLQEALEEATKTTRRLEDLEP